MVKLEIKIEEDWQGFAVREGSLRMSSIYTIPLFPSLSKNDTVLKCCNMQLDTD